MAALAIRSRGLREIGEETRALEVGRVEAVMHRHRCRLVRPWVHLLLARAT